MGVVAPVLQDERDSIREILLALFNGFTLTVRSGNLRAIPDVPLSVPLDDSRELIVEGMLRHGPSL